MIPIRCSESSQHAVRREKLDPGILENWMEKRIPGSSAPDKSAPVRLAYARHHCYRWQERSDPFLRKAARPVKDRLYRRA